ncbi:MAG: hypothetical protein P8166_12210 [Candidatus Thiodiazotropha sp.]
MISGGEWRLTRRLQTDFFDDAHVSIYGDQVNVDVDGNLVIDQYEDEVIELCIIASFEQNGTSFETITHATPYQDTLPGTGAGPLADLRNGSLNIQAKVWVKSIFKVTGDTPVEFDAVVYNHESNLHNSFGRTAIWDLDTGDLVLNLDDRLFSDYAGHAETLLQPNHTYKLLSVINNQTGGDDDISVYGSFHDAMITVAEPSGFVIFSLGLVFLAISKRERPRELRRGKFWQHLLCA